MAQFKEEEVRDPAILEIAKKIAVAARTAPKARGMDNMEIMVLDRKGILGVSNYLKKMVAEDGVPVFFGRDAENILSASAMLVMGTKISTMGLSPCGLCGFGTCDEKKKHTDAPCAFNTGDLGIAIGSAVSIAADNRLDNRIMYTVGIAALQMKLLGEDVKIAYGIPLSGTSKSPFFDRK